MSDSKVVALAYLGTKRLRRDPTNRHSGYVWHGQNSVVNVPEDHAKLLMGKYPTLFCLEADIPKAEKPAKSEATAKSEDTGDQNDAPEGGEGKAEKDGSNASGDTDRMQSIIDAIRGLGAEDYTKQNKPKIKAIVDKLGHNIQPAELTEAVKVLRADGFEPPKAD